MVVFSEINVVCTATISICHFCAVIRFMQVDKQISPDIHSHFFWGFVAGNYRVGLINVHDVERKGRHSIVTVELVLKIKQTVSI